MSGVLLWVCSFRKVPEEPSRGVGTVVIPSSEGSWWAAALRTEGGLAAAVEVCEPALQCAQGVPSHAESKGWDLKTLCL